MGFSLRLILHPSSSKAQRKQLVTSNNLIVEKRCHLESNCTITYNMIYHSDYQRYTALSSSKLKYRTFAPNFKLKSKI